MISKYLHTFWFLQEEDITVRIMNKDHQTIIKYQENYQDNAYMYICISNT